MADLELRNISKKFNGVYALENVSLSCNRGEVHALLGENGAGKSTLLKILSGAYQADEGEIYIFGEKKEIRSPIDAMNFGVGTVYQELTTIPDLTVSQNIFFGRIPKTKAGNFDNKKLRKMTVDLLKKYDVSDLYPDEKAEDLSLSKRQMLEILRILSKDPKIVILDEATSALSDERVRWLLKLARQLADDGKVVIFISHRMAEIRSGCDNMTILRNGHAVCTMPVANADINEVVSHMLGKSMESFFPERIDHTRENKITLSLENVSDGQMLNGVSFEASAGEVLGIGGLAGQGQAELLLYLYGEHNATEGILKINNKEVKIRSPKEALRNGVALVPEDRGQQGVILSKGIGFNISLPSLKEISNGLALSKKKETQLVDTYIDALKIKCKGPEMFVANLSGGNQQKVVMAKIMSLRPNILLMHDITRGVDVGTKRDMFNLVREEAEKGRTILYFSTDIEELTHVCDRVLVMYDGYVNAVLKGDEISGEAIIAASIGEKAEGVVA